MFYRIGKYFRSKLRAWLGVTSNPPETVQQEATRKGLSVHHTLMNKAGEPNLVHRKVAAPLLPPGVVPANFAYDAARDPGSLGAYIALDSELIAPTYSYANQANCGLGFPGYAYLAELSQRSEYRAPSETIASEMTREWLDVTVKGKASRKKRKERGEEVEPPANDEAAQALEDKLEAIEEALDEFGVRDCFRKVTELDGFFGRAQIFIEIDTAGRDPDEVRQLPLVIDKATVKKGSLKGFKVIEPIWTTPYAYNATDPTAPDFYKPRAWFVLGKRTHASRLLTFIMRDVPDILKPAYNFSGLSMSQLMESYVFQWLRTRNSVSDLVHNFSILCLKTNMQNVLSGEPDTPGGVLDRAQLFTRTRDNQGLMLLDKDTEEMEQIAVPLSGLEGLVAQFQEHMAAPSHIPLVKLLGIVPTGLNANSEGEIKVFYDFVRACQQAFYAQHFKTILQLVQLHLFGSIDDAIGFEFVSLTAPTVKELAEIRKSNAETDATYIDKGVLDPAEVRERVAADPDSGYNNISGPPPEPPTLAEMETQHGFNEESAQNAHQRTMEAQEQERDAA